MHIAIRQVTIKDTIIVSDILLEAASWLQERGIPLWHHSEVSNPRLLQEVGDLFVRNSFRIAIYL